MLKINVHSHVVLTETMNKFPPYGPQLIDEADGSVSYQVGKYKILFAPGHCQVRDPRLNNTAARLADMDEKKIDVMGLSVSPLNYLYWAPTEVTTEFSRLQNDEMSKFCKPDPKRLFFLATVPLQDIDASVREIKRAVLELGARALNIGATDSAIGRYADDEYFYPIYDMVQDLGVPLFMHPYPPGIAAGTGENQLDWMAGYIHQSTLVGASMLLGGVFDRFPKLNLVLPHGGGALPYQFGRFDYAARRMKGSKAKHSLYDYMGNLYFDCLVHDVRGRQFLVDFVGVDQVLVGDNYLGWDAVDGFAMVDELNLSDTDRAKIYGGNAQKVFGLTSQMSMLRNSS